MIKLFLVIFSINAVRVYSMYDGSSVGVEQFGYIAAIVRRTDHLCTGIIIDDIHVLTIAHVIINIPLMDLKVIGGIGSFVISRSYRYNVEEIYIHPGFQQRHIGPEYTYYDNDIALLRVHQRFYRNAVVSLVPLKNTGYDRNNYLNCLIVSWQIPFDRRRNQILTWELIKFINDTEIDPQSADDIGENAKIFTDIFGTAIINKVDIGSPIVCGELPVGLVVQAQQSRIRGKPAVFMDIVPYLGFIEETIQDGLFDVDLVNYPYIASIWSENTHVCGGFILDATHVATAGHCVAKYEALHYTVGIPNSVASALWLSIVDIKIHPEYKVETIHGSPIWYMDHDFAILTLGETIPSNTVARPIPWPESYDVHAGDICEVLRWKRHRDDEVGTDVIKLMSSRVVLMDRCFQQQLDQYTRFHGLGFLGQCRYLMPIADSKDVGNPILCAGRPVGFLVQAVSIDGEVLSRIAKFLKIRPYLEFSLNMLNYNE